MPIGRWLGTGMGRRLHSLSERPVEPAQVDSRSLIFDTGACRKSSRNAAPPSPSLSPSPSIGDPGVLSLLLFVITRPPRSSQTQLFYAPAWP